MPEDKYFDLSPGSLSLVPVLREARLEDPIMEKKPQLIEIFELQEYEKTTQESISNPVKPTKV